MMTNDTPEQLHEKPARIAIVGASGIGKNHAAWFVANGAEICAFAGSTVASVERTGEVLKSRIGYAPRGYTDLQTMLGEERLDAVCIASPPECHFDHVQQCLHGEVHVLCEKPLYYDSSLSNAEIVGRAARLVGLAKERSRLLGVQMQYSFLTDQLCAIAGVAPCDITSFEMEMETKNLKPGRSHETIWIELAPHPLSVLQRVASEYELDSDSIRCVVGAQETCADFLLKRADGKNITSRIVTRCKPEASTPLRRFIINGVAVDYAGRKNATGEFLTYLSCGTREVELPDPVNLLIRNFINACQDREPLCVTGDDGVRNVEWMLRILRNP